MDKELDQQINELIEKTTNDLKLKINKIVSKHHTKLMKDHEKELKNAGAKKDKGDKGDKGDKHKEKGDRLDKPKRSKLLKKDPVKEVISDSDCYSD